MTDLSPREIVSELDRFIVGQDDAKRAVAVALRNRWRRKRVPEDLRDEVTPKNILMIGPTGVGKTEIARRLAKLAGSPFLKVEATKFTEVGYVGRDVDQIMRDLVESALVMVRDRRRAGVKARAEGQAEDRILDALVGPGSQPATREAFRKKLRAGELDDKEIEIALADTTSPLQGLDMPGGGNVGLMGTVANAVLAGGGEVTGVIPQQLADWEVAHRGLTELEIVGSMHERKSRMFDLSDAFVALPGGFGTMEEIFEMLTWRQLGIGNKPCAFLDVDGFYAPLIGMIDRMVEERFLHPAQRADLWYGSDIDEMLAWMRAYEPAQASKWIDEKRANALR